MPAQKSNAESIKAAAIKAGFADVIIRDIANGETTATLTAYNGEADMFDAAAGVLKEANLTVHMLRCNNTIEGRCVVARISRIEEPEEKPAVKESPADPPSITKPEPSTAKG